MDRKSGTLHLQLISAGRNHGECELTDIIGDRGAFDYAGIVHDVHDGVGHTRPTRVEDRSRNSRPSFSRIALDALADSPYNSASNAVADPAADSCDVQIR